MTGVQPLPCPVRLGTVKTGGLPAQLHKCTLERNLHKVEKLLKKGVDVDCVNHLGQTPLFCASLLGFTGVAELLLQYGADPNYRCGDRSTPVHAAVFSCNPWLLSELLDAGGDLRVHDDQGRTPRDWAEAGAQEHSPRMLDFLKRCVSHMRSLSQIQYPRNGRVTPTSSKTLLRSPSLLELLRPGGSDLLNKKLSKKSFCDMVQCFGYGKLCIEKARQPIGLLASVPLISESELAQADDEALHSFTCGPFSHMSNYSWRGCRVSVKELQSPDLDGYLDLLITELEYCCRLFHPHLLQLMAVSMSSDLHQSKLVYERVHMDSLYGLLYHRRAEFPVLQVWEALGVVLQVCEALLYLQGRALVLRALSSHCVLLAYPGVAKVTGLGFMVPSEDCHQGNGPPLPLPVGLYNWAAPEVIRRRACTGKADLYSLCTLIQEIYTDAVPWGSVNPRCIKQAVDAGQALCADPAVPQPYYTLLQSGLQPHAENRTCSLQDLRYMLRSDLQELSRKERKVGEGPLSAGLSMSRWSSGLKQDRHPEVPEWSFVKVAPPSAQPSAEMEMEIQDQIQHLDSLLEKEAEGKPSQSSPGSLQSDEVESIPYYEALHRDISYHDILPLENWRLSIHTPSAEAGSSEYLWSSSSTSEDLGTHVALSSSEHIGSIVLNLKVSQVLLQQVQSSLESAELGLEGGAHSEWSHTLPSGNDEVDGVGRRSKSGVLVLKAVGPPSTYRPQLELQERGWAVEGLAGGWQALGASVDDEVSHYCSAGEEGFSTDESDRGASRRHQGGDRQKPGLRSTEQTDRPYGSSHICEHQERATPQHIHLTCQTMPKWTCEVRKVVALMTQGRLGTPARPVSCSQSEEVEEQLPLLARQDPLGHSNRHSVQRCEIEDRSHEQGPVLEQLFKSPADVPSESEGSTDFHTVSQAVSLPSSVCETLSSEEDLDVTMEVCRRTMIVADSPVVEARAVQPGYEKQIVGVPSASGQDPLPTSSHVQDLADIDELSSITCSPDQKQQWTGQQQWAGLDGSLCSPTSRGFPRRNSTPRSPGTHAGANTGPGRSPHGKEWVGMDPLPYLQGALATSPSGSPCTGAYTTASLGARYRTDPLESSILQCAEVRELSQEGTEAPSTPVSSETKHSVESRAQAHSQQTNTAPGCVELVEAQPEEEEKEESVRDSCASGHSTSRSSMPSLDAAPAHLLAVGLDEDSDVLDEEEECEEQSNPEDHQESFEEELLGTDKHKLGLDNGKPSHSPEALQETQRAHSTLDRVLDGLSFGETVDSERATGDPQACSEDKCVEQVDAQPEEEEVEESVRGSCTLGHIYQQLHETSELRKGSGCPGGDSRGMAAGKGAEFSDKISSGNANEQGETTETASHIAWRQPHRVIILEHTPVRTQSETAQAVCVEVAHPCRNPE